MLYRLINNRTDLGRIIVQYITKDRGIYIVGVVDTRGATPDDLVVLEHPCLFKRYYVPGDDGSTENMRIDICRLIVGSDMQVCLRQSEYLGVAILDPTSESFYQEWLRGHVTKNTPVTQNTPV